MHHQIPLALLRDLRCRHCTKFVSCGPVHVVPDGSILCGRCRALAKPKFRNIAYETIAPLFYFPCCYWTNYCSRALNWDESHHHESNCVYKSTCKLLCSHPGVLFKSERKLPEIGDASAEHVTEQMLEILKCAICESYLSCDPVYIGIDGKNVCHRCVTSNGIPVGVVRNLSYEKLASAIIFPCIYRFRGCTIKIRYGRDLWQHESECSYGQVYKKVAKKPSKNGKERGVIPTLTGHIYGTITPTSALFVPVSKNNTNKEDSQHFSQELANVMKKKQNTSSVGDEEPNTADFNRYQAFDSQSVESIFDQSVCSTGTKLSSDDALEYQDNTPKVSVQQKLSYPDNNFFGNPKILLHQKTSIDESLNGDASTFQNNYRDPRVSGQYENGGYYQELRASIKPTSRPSTREEDYPRSSNEGILNYNNPPATPPVSAGYLIPPHGYYQENLTRWPAKPSNYDQMHLYHFPPLYFNETANVKYSPSFNNYQNPYDYHQQVVRRSESLRVGNKEIIEELKARQNKKAQNENGKRDESPYVQCNNLQEIVQKHDEVFTD